MTGLRHRRRDRSVSPRWGWLVAAVGAAGALLGGWLVFAGGGPAAGPTTVVSRPAAEAERYPLAQPNQPTATPRTPVPTRSTSTPNPGKPTATATKPQAGGSSTSGRPVRLLVPRLGLSARVVGIRARGGALIPPSNPRVVGWWSDGARPGRTGSALITGHTVHSGGGAFDQLDRLVAGNTVVVTTASARIRYAVVAVTTYRKQALARHAAEVFDQGTPSRLVLVTCEDWNGRVYLSNVVVIAEPVR